MLPASSSLECILPLAYFQVVLHLARLLRTSLARKYGTGDGALPAGGEVIRRAYGREKERKGVWEYL